MNRPTLTLTGAFPAHIATGLGDGRPHVGGVLSQPVYHTAAPGLVSLAIRIFCGDSALFVLDSEDALLVSIQSTLWPKPLPANVSYEPFVLISEEKL
jgi:hypothetical protein